MVLLGNIAFDSVNIHQNLPKQVQMYITVKGKLVFTGGKYGISRGTFFQGHRNSGPHYRSGHYLTLEKLPSANPVLTT